jgi:hypothetical protein
MDVNFDFERYVCEICGCRQRSGGIEVYRRAVQKQSRVLIALAFAGGITLGAWICALIMC